MPDIFIFVLYAVLFSALIWRWKFFHLTAIPRWWMPAAMGLKIFAGIIYWVVFTHFFQGKNDSFQYFNDTMLIHEQWEKNRDVFWSLMSGEPTDDPSLGHLKKILYHWDSGLRYGLTNDVSTLLKLNVLIAFISGGSFFVHGLFMGFFAFIGLTALFKAFVGLFAAKEKWLFIACFALPSVVFWSSSLIKEAPLMMAFGLLLWSVEKWFGGKWKWKHVPVFLASFTLMIFLKEYVLIALAPALVFLVVIKLSGQRFVVMKCILVHALCFVVAQNAHHFFMGGDFLYVLNKKRVDFTNTAMLYDAKSVIKVEPVVNTIEFVLSWPRAFALTYLRPHLAETRTWPQIVASIENTIYALLIFLALLTLKRPDKKHIPLLLASLSFVLALAFIIGNCVTILGALVRYRIPGLVLLIILCFYFINWPLLRKKISAIRPSEKTRPQAQ
ncbi:MAG: hypothetical protein SH856_00820 [Flavobacteriales bacterium]|nr:hypothetical protein [Flavobacteriales bacterium]